ncbi:MAG: DnaA/Hda family protein, partial [Pseudomonadota bacterium]
MTDDAWVQVRSNLKEILGSNSYTSWIEPLGFAQAEGGVFTLLAPTTFNANYVKQNFSDLILHKLRDAGADVDRLSFTVDENRVRDMKAPTNAPKSDASQTGLDSRFTFDTFIVGKPNELAHAAARRVAEGGPVGFNPLFLHGGVGLGKTHLMHAIAHELQSRSPELNVLYVSAEQFMYRFITALRDRKIMDFKSI